MTTITLAARAPSRERQNRMRKKYPATSVTPPQMAALDVLSRGDVSFAYREVEAGGLHIHVLRKLHEGRFIRIFAMPGGGVTAKITSKGEHQLKRADDLAARPAPRPWAIRWAAKAGGKGNRSLFVVDADGRTILAVWGRPNEKEVTARMIVDLANREVCRGEV